MGLSRFLLELFGWRVRITVPDYPKCIICVAPHTSNWDFVLGKLAYASVGRKAGFLMKESWFFFPLGLIFKAIGGIPVARGRKHGSLVSELVERFNASSRMVIAITPEGTRSLTDTWRTGFLHIARQADVPVALGAIDYGRKEVVIDMMFEPTGDVQRDIDSIKDYYSQFEARYPDKFSTRHTAPQP